jgi:hypothetical protein
MSDYRSVREECTCETPHGSESRKCDYCRNQGVFKAWMTEGKKKSKKKTKKKVAKKKKRKVKP